MQKSTMKWDDLRVFLAVARQSRLLAPAARSGSTRRRSGGGSPRSRRRSGARLFDRSPQGYAMTEAGRSLLAHAQAMESQASAAAEEVGGQSDRLSGTVRIGAPGRGLELPADRRLRRAQPRQPRAAGAGGGAAADVLAVQARGGPRDHRLAADRRAADGAQDRRLPAAPLRPRRPRRGARRRCATMDDLREPARHRLHLGHDLRQGARLLRAARARDRAGADLEQPDHAAALVPARRRRLHPARVRRARASRARAWCCPTTSG